VAQIFCGTFSAGATGGAQLLFAADSPPTPTRARRGSHETAAHNRRHPQRSRRSVMSREAIQELLAKQKRVEDVVQRQHLVENMLHRQHLVELETFMSTLPVEEVGAIFESLPLEDAKRLWPRVPEERRNDILWQVSDSVREHLDSVRDQDPSGAQANAFVLVDGRLNQIAISDRADLKGGQAIWIDLLNAGPNERARVGQQFDLELPDPGDATDLEVSSRFHVAENDEIHLHSNFLLDREGNSRSVPVAFILHRGVLFSLRNEELPVFRLQRQRARTRPGSVNDCHDLLLELYGADVEYSADSLESIYGTLSRVGRQVLSESISDTEAASVLANIAEEENLNGQIRSNILDTQRALVFLMQRKVLSESQVADTKQILRNIESLNSHTAFLFDKINFLMDATIGFININQNRRVSQLTVFGVVFMPINILAGIGGMSEFSMMTQGIPWPFAYASFVAAMGFIGWAMYAALKYGEARKLRAGSKRDPLTRI
jgi:magnesium transporter